MKVKVVKSKVSPPMQSCEIPLFYERGFVDFADLDTVRKEIMEEHKKCIRKCYSDILLHCF